MKRSTEKHVDNLLYRARRYLVTADDQSFKDLLSEMRIYWAYIHEETCPFHLLEKVKKKNA
jgi:hypothetical protein